MKILLVEDDFALAMGTEFALQAEGYEVIRAKDVSEAKSAVTSSKPDLILLDVMLPDGNGYDLCRQIRGEGNMVPIIFLTAVGEEANIVQGLELGADDYVTKPYRVKELLSRIAANLRRSRMATGIVDENVKDKDVYSFGHHEFNNAKFILYNDGQIVDCTPSELRLLRELLIHEGQVLTRTQLLERLYDTEDNFIDDNTLSVYMKRLRTKLSGDASFIETVRGVGYRFVKQ